MSAAIFPLALPDEVRLLTAVVLGFLFGFSLERAGFGNARKLAAQFYFRDMTVFKVMFTAILVAMVGLYVLVDFGLVDMSLMWVNPTFLWAQVVGGFVLGVGFILSGLCPGTSVVSAASGRWDAVVTFAGIFVGVFAFSVAMDRIPALQALYESGSLGVSVLPTLLGAPPVLLALGVVVVAGLAFLGAEKVESRVGGPHAPVELTPAPRPRMKLGVAGVLAGVAVLGLGVHVRPAPAAPASMAGVDPLDLADALIQRTAGLMVLDLREGEPESRIPGAYPVDGVDGAVELLESAPAGTRVVVYDAEGSLRAAPPGWPRRLTYRYLEGGFFGWEFRVLTPAPPGDTAEERAWAARQNQISGYFTGAAVESSGAPAPPPMPAGGGAAKKKGGGC